MNNTDFMEKMVFSPLGMKSSFYGAEAFNQQNNRVEGTLSNQSGFRQKSCLFTFRRNVQ